MKPGEPQMNEKRQEKSGSVLIRVHPRALAVLKKLEPRIDANEREYKKTGSVFAGFHSHPLVVFQWRIAHGH
jgi:hypothetical protein